ncbi:MAG: hypothetical protein KME23_16135 [Goleter apudmare HA4340-LM2]|nr:hypothetical protein [Goleter apudmare HA4340-LM2]
MRLPSSASKLPVFIASPTRQVTTVFLGTANLKNIYLGRGKASTDFR